MLGFTTRILKSEGLPSFESKVFLKLYLYGYLNGLRSSRKLEKESIRNIELHLGKTQAEFKRSDTQNRTEKSRGTHPKNQ
ncbi:transposase [Flavobacterium polysaccharolyticum]|uniref:transposase n=1 Tax=Flavobacterium polysaccharolyticum TaxID=3133148 RepID=UPI003CCC312B